MKLSTEQIARVCHETNRAYCVATGDASQRAWDDCPDWQRTSCIRGVVLHLTQPGTTPEKSHVAWLEEKAATGWKWGPEKNEMRREHPCFCPYADLPEQQRIKDELFTAVIAALAPYAEVTPL
jgi:hypothetical protein